MSTYWRRKLPIAAYGLKRCFYLILLGYWLPLAGFSSALVAAPNESSSSSILISASIVPAAKRFASFDRSFELRIGISEASSSSVSPSGDKVYIPLTALFDGEGGGVLKLVEVVVWVNPRHFSLYSNRHGFLDLGPAAILGDHVVMAVPEPSADKTAPLALQLRKEAPANETSTIGILLFAEGELIAELPLPYRTGKNQLLPAEDVLSSPFRPDTRANYARNDDGVLTIIQLRPHLVQLAFACGFGLSSWRVTSGSADVKNWPQYVSKQVSSGVDPKTIASTLSDILFPSGSRCKTGCSAASVLFKTWMRRAAGTEQPPALKVQILPLGDSEDTFTTLMMPVGMLCILDECEDGSHLKKTQESEALLLDPVNQRELLSTNEISSSLEGTSLERDDSGTNWSVRAAQSWSTTEDPADPEFPLNLPLVPVEALHDLYVSSTEDSIAEPAPIINPLLDPASFEANDDRGSISTEDVVEQADSSGEQIFSAERSLADSSGSVPEDPQDPGLAINQRIVALKDPALPGDPVKSSVLGGSDFLGQRVVVYVPLYRTTASAGNGLCAQTWSVLLPPEGEEDVGLNQARTQMRPLIDIWRVLKAIWRMRGFEPTFQYFDSITPLKKNEPPPTSAWLIVSHFDNETGALQMPRVRQFVGAGDLRRDLVPPGVVLLLACEGGIPADHEFLSNLIERGISTLITTNSPLPGDVAGQFATTFIEVLGEAGMEGIPVRDALWETLTRLDAQYAAPRFVLAGDPMTKLCAPPLTW